MRNRKKDLILDFTSLLDIVLLLLFFFILFSKVGADTSVKNAQQEAQKAKNKYDALTEEVAALRGQLKYDIETVDQVTSQEAEELIAFNHGNNLKILLLDGGGTSKPLIIRAVLNRRVIGECLLTDSDDMAADQEKDINTEKMLGWLTECGMNSDTVIMCDFVYDADLPRTSEACDKINNIFEEIREKYGYRHFYCSSTDLSIGSRE